MKKGKMINRKTGEIIEDWEYTTDIKPKHPNQFYQRVMVNSRSFDESNIGMFEYPEEKETEESEDALFGKFKNLRSKRGFTKVYYLEDPGFSTGSYYQCWFKILCHLAKNTNVIFTRTNKGNVTCSSVQDLIALSGKTRGTFYKFYKEAREKNLIAEFKLKEDKYYIVNPQYSLNGWKMPQVLFDLFDNPLRGEPNAS